ncbi:MAG: argininosuccinate lyase [Actinomycetota bacterium]
MLAAHVGMLQPAGIISEADAKALREALPDIAHDIQTGRYPILDSDEDVHTAVERAMLERVPDAAGNARAGLSRNDRVVTAFRLWSIEHARLVRDAVLDLIEALANQASEHRATTMPGYTHLQRAQPVTVGLALSAHALACARDADRIRDAAQRTSEMPLGAGALAGTSFDLDREQARKELGFERTLTNTMDAVAARDFALEMLSAYAILAVHLSRISEELILWTSAEFGFAQLADAYATGSSLMPHKKNPDVAELARGKAGRIIGDLTGLLATCKGLPLAYNRDLQEDKEPLFDAVDTLLIVLPALTGAIRTLTFNSTRLKQASSDPFLMATEMAETLARSMPFRDAHEAVGRAVRDALEHGTDLDDLTGAGLLVGSDRSQSRAVSATDATLAEIAALVASHRAET